MVEELAKLQFDQLRVARQLEGFAAMRTKPRGAPDAAHRHAADTGAIRHLARTPARSALGVLSSVRITTCSTCSSLAVGFARTNRVALCGGARQQGGGAGVAGHAADGRQVAAALRRPASGRVARRAASGRVVYHLRYRAGPGVTLQRPTLLASYPQLCLGSCRSHTPDWTRTKSLYSSLLCKRTRLVPRVVNFGGIGEAAKAARCFNFSIYVLGHFVCRRAASRVC